VTDKKLTKPVTSISRTAARVSIVAVITYQVTLVALIFIRPDLDPSWHTISEWAIGPHGWIMSLAFLISAVSYGSLFIAIKSQTRGIGGKIGLGMLLICFIGTIGVGVFTTDPMTVVSSPMTGRTPLSTTGTLHIIFGGSALMLLPFAALLINLNLALKNKAWLSARRVLLWTSGLPFLGLVGFVVHLVIFVIPLGENAYGPGVPIGWPPRFLFLSYMVWLITLAWQTGKHKELMPAAGQSQAGSVLPRGVTCL
jgi:hypothetical protein